MLRSNATDMLLSTLLSIRINLKGIINFLDNVELEISDSDKTSINFLVEEITTELKTISPSKPNKTVIPIQHNFAIALAFAGIKRAEWARRNDLTDQALSQLLMGKMKSKHIMHLVEQFISNEFSKLKINENKAA